ncbi:ABC transporter permease [Arthrobacter castelli]|uniref:ABC transporter permease n=1 Tax=Arthrobacter castelli TaxID=271431 RepID=UPI00041C6BCE|nr:ABC transporter permease [Arthrobacter castelli]
MSIPTTVFRAGMVRGRSELRHTFTNFQDLWGYIFPAGVLLVVMLLQSSATVGATGFSLGASTLPGAIGMGIAFAGLMSVAGQLITEREDGTLLRNKAIPHGMTGYMIGKIVLTIGMSVVSLLLLLVPGLFIFDGIQLDAGGVLVLVVVFVLGMAATMPIGAVIGSLFSNPTSMGFVMLPMMGLIGISGIFYPLAKYPEWLQWIGQVFPIYWLGLGMRSSMLPDSLVTVEIGDSWRHWETFGVLGAWAVLGLVLAPIVLRRMARRESGSAVASRRERAMARMG